MPSKRTFFEKAPSTKFVVRNVSTNGKTVRVFNTPIRNGATYDLLSVPDVSEADIRHSLLKGELRIKFLYGELIVVDADIDLLQFNDEHKAFLEQIGLTKGLEVEGTGGVSLPPPTQECQVLFALTSTEFTPQLPLTSDGGWLVNDDGCLLVVG